ncbi:hypothetical protein [Streptomyces pharetrae]|uniref:hypothetical protein n=1 Tax=Streptomyces pharetrae TaxID=291370 RepID=UPI0036A77A29
MSRPVRGPHRGRTADRSDSSAWWKADASSWFGAGGRPRSGAFGCVIEDLLLVPDDGHEVLHRLPHELTVVG